MTAAAAAKSLQLCLTLFQSDIIPLMAAHQAPLSLRFSRQGYGSGFPFPSPEDLPDPGIKSGTDSNMAERFVTI